MLHIYNSWPVVRFLIYSKSCRCRYKFKCILSQSVPPSPGVLSICLWLSVPLVSIVWSFSSAHVFYIIIFLLLLPVKHCAFFNVRVIIFSQTMLQSLKSFALLFFFFSNLLYCARAVALSGFEGTVSTNNSACPPE